MINEDEMYIKSSEILQINFWISLRLYDLQKDFTDSQANQITQNKSKNVEKSHILTQHPKESSINYIILIKATRACWHNILFDDTMQHLRYQIIILTHPFVPDLLKLLEFTKNVRIIKMTKLHNWQNYKTTSSASKRTCESSSNT